MEEKKLEKERTLVINIKLTRGLVAVLIASLLVVAFVGYLALGQKRVSASPAAPEVPEASTASSSGLRKFYRTLTVYSPTQASTACAPGYHFASIWELLDPSNLEYAGELDDAWGGPYFDMGEGPATGVSEYPTVGLGYVRTGYNVAPDLTGYPGQANCSGWASDSFIDHGTVAGLTYEWGTAEDLFVWNIDVFTCNVRTGVWCVED